MPEQRPSSVHTYWKTQFWKMTFSQWVKEGSRPNSQKKKRFADKQDTILFRK